MVMIPVHLPKRNNNRRRRQRKRRRESQQLLPRQRNNSDKDRKAIYATYNCKSEGDLHDAYYEDRAKMWPPTHKRKEGEKYELGALRYGFGSPMLSVDLGKQFVV